ncbi:MAG: hypothetical protein AAF600_11425 [Bacteroidota bacterium]
MGLKTLHLNLQSFFYLAAGVNHFINPEFYYPLIPNYFIYTKAINLLAGFFEMLFGITFLFTRTRNFAVYGILSMLLAFIPSHIYFIQTGSCIEEGLCVPEWIGWFRLIVIHPLLIWWAWSQRLRH